MPDNFHMANFKNSISNSNKEAKFQSKKNFKNAYINKIQGLVREKFNFVLFVFFFCL